MTGTLLRVSWINLKRDRVALGLVFVLPVVIFSIFAAVFAGMGGGREGMPAVEVALVDEDLSDTSRRLAAALDAEESLDVRLGPGGGPSPGGPAPRYDRASVRKLVEDGDIRAALVIPAGFGEAYAGDTWEVQPRVEVLADTVADPIAHQVVAGLLQKVAMTAAPDLWVERGVGMFEKYGGGLTEQQRAALDAYLPRLRELAGSAGGAAGSPGSGAAGAEAAAGGSAGPSGEAFAGMIDVEVTDVRTPGAEAERVVRRKRIVSFYAASIGVMFLLFSMTGAASSLLQEETTGTLERLLNSGVSMGRLLCGYWGFAAAMGFLELTVMFLWGWAVFGLEFWTPKHVSGFVVMTAVATSAASAFGLMLGTLCRSTGQLMGISTIVILVMSAAGGSMFPRFLMSERMQAAGLATFNGWAIDGYQKVFWRDRTVLELWPQVLVLAGMTVVFLLGGRVLARRWEAA